MIPVGLVLPLGEMPRTVFYDRLIAAVQAHPWYRSEGGRLVLPLEDTAQETNWPRYGDPASAYVRGAPPDLRQQDDVFFRYLNAVAAYAKAHPAERVLVVNMQPSVRLPRMLRRFANVLVADGSTPEHERALNPRVIGMPALPIVSVPRTPATERSVLASFQGAASHPIREELAQLHNDAEIVVRLIDPANHKGRIDAVAGRTDEAYEALLDASVFAFVPRGDALFSYRLLEVMARGAIPVILSDGWVLPFDRTLDWSSMAVRVARDHVGDIPALLRSFTAEDIDRLRTNGGRAYETVFSSLDQIAAALIAEACALPW